jgi:hypothetical protein
MLKLSVFEVLPLSWELDDALIISASLLQMLKQPLC